MLLDDQILISALGAFLVDHFPFSPLMYSMCFASVARGRLVVDWTGKFPSSNLRADYAAIDLSFSCDMFLICY